LAQSIVDVAAASVIETRIVTKRVEENLVKEMEL